MRVVPCAIVTLLRSGSERHGGLAGQGRRLKSRRIPALLLQRFPGLQTAPECVRATARCVEGQAKGFQETIGVDLQPETAKQIGSLPDVCDSARDAQGDIGQQA